jgi:hypothetical protein
MMTAKSPFLAKVSCGLSIAFLALAFTSSVSAVRAESDALAPSWRETFIDPILDAVKAVEDRLTNIEAKVAVFGWSFTSRQITAQELCVADDAGARTCISKAQLDGLLKMMQAAATGQPAAAAGSVTEPKAVIEPAEVAPPTPATGTKASVLEKPAEIETTTAAAAPRPAAMAAKAARVEDTLGQAPVPTGSVPASPASPDRALVTYPEVEIIIPSTDD